MLQILQLKQLHVIHEHFTSVMNNKYEKISNLFHALFSVVVIWV